ncbi:MAG: GNAT family N-acetyltransferase [Haloglomus sp.]
MPGPVFIETDRLELRTVEAEDAGVVQRGRMHPEVRRHIAEFRAPRSEEAIADEVPNDDAVRLLVVPKTGDMAKEPVGEASLDYIHEEDGWANISFWLFPAARGRGYATEAAANLVAFGFRERGLRRVTANAVAPNEGSLALLERLGFVHEGTQREKARVNGEFVDVEFYGLLRREWDGVEAALDD